MSNIKRICNQCNNEFLFRGCPTDIISGRGRFCSNKCKIDFQRKLPKFFICETCGIKFNNKYGKIKRFCSHKCYAKYLTGKEPWNKGKTGLQTAWNKGKKGYQSGKNNANWRGGITPENERQRRTLEYKDWRKAVFKRDKYTCQHCNSVGHKLNAHHIKSFSKYPKLRIDVNNGLTLCKECHLNHHKTKL